MLTSPVNVTIAANGAALKANTAASDNSARREPPHLPAIQAQQAEMVIEPEQPSKSPLANMNAVTATVGSRTVLQELTLNIATMLRIVRRQDENLTSLFLRVIATIDAMPQMERLQLEIRAGLKPLKITLADLAMALRKPDGREAAHLTALAETPTSSRTAANAATTTYLEEGTDSGHTEEALAMRAAARHSAAGQSVFSAENKARPADAQPADAKVLQNHLMTMFEPGEARPSDAEDGPLAQNLTAMELPNVGEESLVEGMDAGASGQDTAVAVLKPLIPSPSGKGDEASGAAAQGKTATWNAASPNLKQALPLPTTNAGESVTFSSANLKLDPPTVERIRNVAQAIAIQAETTGADQQDSVTENSEDRRLQTMLTLKGLAEVVIAIPSKAAELLAIVVAEAAASPLEMADENREGAEESLRQAFDEDQRPELVMVSDERLDENAVALAENMPIEIPVETSAPTAQRAEAAVAEEHQSLPDSEGSPLTRSDLAQHAVPFAYVQVQPAREDKIEAVEEEDIRDEADENGENDGDEDGEPRRPPDEYDAIHDPVPEEEEAIVINRDSSESDRAFALYQRMGGF